MIIVQYNSCIVSMLHVLITNLNKISRNTICRFYYYRHVSSDPEDQEPEARRECPTPQRPDLIQ